MKKLKLKSLGIAAILSLTGSGHLSGGEAFFDFNTDPTDELTIISDQADNVWQETGGNDGGFLSITEAVGSIGTKVIFPDFDDGLIVKAFTFSMDVRMGNGITDRPADGFSVSYAREGDPALSNTTAQGGFTPAAENGTGTGIAIGFDAWQGNALPDGADIEGIIVRVDNVTVLRQPLPTRHGECDDVTSLQTGPQDPLENRTGSADNLCWQPVEVILNDAAQLTVRWKGETILENFQTQYFPSAGRLILAGRTGGANQNHHVDNLRIQTVGAESFLIGAISSHPSGFNVGIVDAPGSVLDPDSIELTLDGNPVEVTSFSKTGDNTTVSYDISPDIFPAGSTHVVDIRAADMTGGISVATREFTVVNYATLSPALAVDGVDTSAPGFRVHPYGTNEDQPNTIQWTEEQLAGLHGENLALLQGAGPDSDNDGALDLVDADSEGYYDETTVINYNVDLNAAGNFSTPEGDESLWHFDRLLPGTPGLQSRVDGTDPGTGNLSLEILTFLEFPAEGVYTMGVNSDDGFKVSVSQNSNDVLSPVAGFFDAGRGAEDTHFSFLVEEPGIYPFRLIWFNGAGGASVEWFMVMKDGTRQLINNPDVPEAIKAYRTSSSGMPAYASSANPAPNQTDFQLGLDIVIELTDDDTQVDENSVALSVNGNAQTPMVVKSGDVTTITLPSGGLLAPGAANSIELSYSAGGSTVTRSWSFTTGGQPAGNIVRVYDPIVGSSDNTPGAETVDKAIDGDSGTKYLNFDAGAADGNLPTGLTVWTVSSVVTGMDLTSANDAPGRDPATYELWGALQGSEFELISEGAVPAFADRFTTVSILFDNELVYDAYQVIFPTIVDPSVNSMQIAEVELIGLAVASDVSTPSSPVVGSSENTPGAETPDLAIDNNTATKYLNFDAGSANGNLPTGLTVTTGNSVVTGLGLTSANDAPERDPATYELWGSLLGGAFELISEGDVPAFADRFTRVEIVIANSAVYDTYQITFPTVANPASANSMQIAEIEFLGQKARIDVSQPSNTVVGSSDNTPGAETPDLAIDNDTATKYLNFDAGSANGNLPTGLTIATGESLVTGLGLTSANDAPERDPATYEVWGSIGGGEFVLIASGEVPAFAARFTRVEVNFHNSTVYSEYEVVFPTVADPAAANSMQIAEVELLGESLAPPVEGPIMSIAQDGANVVVEWNEGTLQSSDFVEGPYANVAGAASPFSVVPEGNQFFRVMAPLTFHATLNGANARPNPITTGATGSGTFTLSGLTLTVDVTYQGLESDFTNAHIHGPADLETAAGVLQGLNTPELHTPTDTRSGAFSGTVEVSQATADAIVQGMAYINIHTTGNGGGEIRGQLLP